jgi:hypothetical protein
MRLPSVGLVASLCTTPLGLSAQAPPAKLEPATAPVAVLSTALYNEQANIREDSE